MTKRDRTIIYHVFTRLFGNTNTTNKPWGTIEENGVGKFNDFSSAALQEIKKMGFTHIWYTGVLEHALLTDYTRFGIPLDYADVVKGRAGSPYAIKDYYDVNPDLAESVPNRMVEFEGLVKRTHQANLKVIIDFVPNHVARKYHSDVKPEGLIDLGADDNPAIAFHQDNNFYYLPDQPLHIPEGYHSLGPYDFPTKGKGFQEVPAKATGNDVFSASPGIHDWFETVKLNYGVDYLDNRACYFDPIPDTWHKMKDILLFWAGKNIDGFRCDMAEMVPVEFWQWVSKEVKKEFPEMIFIAEIYNPNAYRDYIFKGGFDFLYDKVELYDTLKSIIQKKATTDHLTPVWQRQEGIGWYMLRFLENHDEQRIASPCFAGCMEKGIPMMAASAFMHTGPVMVYFGQEVGEPAQGECGFSGDDGRTTIFDYWGVPEHIKWVNDGKFDGGGLSVQQKALRKAYIDILTACNKNEAFQSGSFFDLHYYNRSDSYHGYSDQVYAFLRHSDHQVLLVVINFSENTEKTIIKVPYEAWRKIGITCEQVAVKALDKKEPVYFLRHPITDVHEQGGVEMELAPLSYQVHEISKKVSNIRVKNKLTPEPE